MMTTNATHADLLTAAKAACRAERRAYATVAVILPDTGAVARALAADVARDDGQQSVRVQDGQRLEYWWGCQLRLAPVAP